MSRSFSDLRLAVSKLLEAMEERFSLMNERMDDLSNQLEHSQKESSAQLIRVNAVVEKLCTRLPC